MRMPPLRTHERYMGCSPMPSHKATSAWNRAFKCPMQARCRCGMNASHRTVGRHMQLWLYGTHPMVELVSTAKQPPEPAKAVLLWRKEPCTEMPPLTLAVSLMATTPPCSCIIQGGGGGGLGGEGGGRPAATASALCTFCSLHSL